MPAEPSRRPPGPAPTPATGWGASVVAVLVRPGLWPIGLVQVFRLAPRGWWRRWPFLPRPDPAYLRFRLITAYGRDDRAPEPTDVVAYLRWCRTWYRAGWSSP